MAWGRDGAEAVLIHPRQPANIALGMERLQALQPQEERAD